MLLHVCLMVFRCSIVGIVDGDDTVASLANYSTKAWSVVETISDRRDCICLTTTAISAINTMSSNIERIYREIDT